MFKISPAVRVSFGLVMFTLSVIMIADLFGIVPKKHLITLEARKKVCEVLAVQLSVAVSKSDIDMVQTSLEFFVDRNNDVRAASMSQVDGTIVAEFGLFDNYKASTLDVDEEESIDNIVVVPVFAGAEKWGTVNVEFNSVYAGGMFSFLTDSILGILLFVAISGFIGYLFILKKALRVLDPKAVVPDRVRSAFNALSEGVLIVDKKEQIIMANDAFAKKLNINADELLGIKASSFKWKYINRDLFKSNTIMPWMLAIKEGVNKIGVSLNLSTPDAGVRALSTNCAPILDDNGDTRGALVTFDDITDVEETNVLLENAVTTLTMNENEIQRKNEELEVLATRDSLTGCYNRRAFFDLFDKSLEQAIENGQTLSCIMMDIDFFKGINDSYGHATGDEAIRMIADVLNNHCDNEIAIIGRYGGEEFCLILPGSDADDAVNIAEHLRQTIQTISKGFCAENVSITASFGVAFKTDETTECAQILDMADKALYAAKESGRNKVILWGQDNTAAGSDEDDADKNVVINLNDRITKNSVDPVSQNNDPVDDEKILLLENKIEELQNKLNDETAKANLQEESRGIDPITKLPSKLIFIDRVNQSIAHSARKKKLLAVAMLNVDMVNRINDTLGREVGDEFLREVGYRLKAILRQSDTVASMLSSGNSGPLFSRIDDDNFALLLPGFDEVETLTYVIQRIESRFEGNIKASGNEFYLTSHIGLAVFPQDGETADMLIENAFRAKKQAKTLGGRNKFQFYSQVDNSRLIEQMQSEIDLHNAIVRKQFVLYYQPKLDIKSGAITSMEALIRWEHPKNGLVFPDSFIPVAEKTGMILEISKWCLETACKQSSLWVEMGEKNIRTSINVSAAEFAEEHFKENVLAALKRHKLNARHLEIEITESTIMADAEAAHKLIDELRFIGITITLDDFGTGYSSLSFFGDLDIDWLKLDRTFLLKAMDNVRSRSIYSSIIKMVHATGVRVVTEGVETQEQYDYVKELKVDEVQGYLISRPLESVDVTARLFPELLKKNVSQNT
jgi:diguanylate cyclase (GGDEF)-like protein